MAILFKYLFNGNANDATGNGYNGTATASISYPTSLFGRSANFTTTYQAIDAPTITGMDTGNGAYCIEQISYPTVAATSGDYNIFWRWSTGVEGQHPCFFYYGGYGNNAYRVRIQNTSGTFYGDPYVGGKPYPFVANTIYHVALNVGGGYCEVWINGKIDQTISVTGTAYKRTNGYCIGNRTYNKNEGWEGRIDEHTYYDSKLSTADVKNKYTYYKGFF